MSEIEFEAFPKIPRLNRGMVITEKLDGTNAAVVVIAFPFGGGSFPDYNRIAIIVDDDMRDADGTPECEYHVYAQSRNKFITPGKSTDNYGFAGWVHRNAEMLVKVLGEGRHFGEWWGSGIQRGYGLTGPDKRFSLFNSARWADTDFSSVAGLDVVPVLHVGKFDNAVIAASVTLLGATGSVAAPGFMRAEGVVVFQSASRTMFKVTVDKDDEYKGAAGHLLDEEKSLA